DHRQECHRTSGGANHALCRPLSDAQPGGVRREPARGVVFSHSSESYTPTSFERGAWNMSDRTIDRLGVMCGVLCVLLGIVAVGLGTGTAAANPGASPEEIARAYASAPTPLGWS